MKQINRNRRLDNNITSQVDNKEIYNVNADETVYLRVKYLEEQLRNITQNRTERKRFAQKIYCLTLIWVCFIFFVVIIQGSPVNFYLSDTTMIAFLTGSSVNVIGLMAIVIRYLFPPNSK